MCPDRCVNRQPSLEGSVCQRGSSLAPSPPASVHSGSPGRWASESEDLCLRPSQVIRGSWGLLLGKAVEMRISPEGRHPPLIYAFCRALQCLWPLPPTMSGVRPWHLEASMFDIMI